MCVQAYNIIYIYTLYTYNITPHKNKHVLNHNFSRISLLHIVEKGLL